MVADEEAGKFFHGGAPQTSRSRGCRAVFIFTLLLPFICSGAEPRKPQSPTTPPPALKQRLNVKLPGRNILTLVRIPKGKFSMSVTDDKGNVADKELELVFKQDFYLSSTEITQEQYQAVMKENPACFKGKKMPVERVSWHDAMRFCRRLNELNLAPPDWCFTLPTEAQWEYAAAEGINHWDAENGDKTEAPPPGWYKKNSGGKPHPVGTQRPNKLGLYDMCGNVCEWCLDDYIRDGRKIRAEYRRGEDSRTTYRVFRGGSWGVSEELCQPEKRFGAPPLMRSNFIGFRVALVRM